MKKKAHHLFLIAKFYLFDLPKVLAESDYPASAALQH